MSDIKRDAEIGLRAGGWVPVAETDELRAEIERLQQKLADPCYTELWDKTEEAAQKRDAEIERLRDAIFRHRERVWGEGKVDHPEDVTLQLRAEVERLKSEINMARHERHQAEDRADEMFNGCQQRDVEIKRLRAAIFRHRERVWGEGKVEHPEDVTLYEALGDE